MAIVPVIMCGGGGSRLWPTSRPSRPKQFLRLLGDRSLFQETIRRLSGLPGLLDPVIVAGVAHEVLIAEQLEEIGQAATVLLEPEPRDSGPAITAAMLHIAERDPHAIAVVLASDHHIPAVGAFQDAILRAVDVAGQGRLVVLGVKPDAPSSAYGYIRPGKLIDAQTGGREVDRFVEKPDRATAERYLEEGCLWNSGNFVAPVSLLIDELKLHAPELISPVSLALAEGVRMGAARRLAARFSETPKISFDYAVMEKTSRAAVLPVDFTWSDLGAWDAVWAAGDRNLEANSVKGSALLIDTAGAVVRAADGMMVSTVGIKNLAVIVERDAVLVCALDSAQSVKTVVERINERSWAPAGETSSLTRDLQELSHRLDDWLDVSALPLWWSLGADHSRGGFHEHLSLAGRPVDGVRRARVQMRQVYVYAAAGAAGWGGPWRQAVDHGLDYFERCYRRSDGLFRTVVDASGAPVDETAMLYDQAFALLAWATAAQVTRSPAFENKACELLERIKDQRRCFLGGFAEAGESSHQSNPHMHLLEAALAWMAVGRSACWEALAQEIVNLALSRFIDADRGYLREHFDAAWRPAAGDFGRIVEPGHQFEWSWLLGRWFKLTSGRAALEAARVLFKHGVAGVDPRRGVAVDSLNDDLEIRNPQARLWPQTERLKAALLLAELDPLQRRFYEAEAAAAARSLLNYLQAPVLGVWRDKLSADGSWKDEPAPASSLYHIACAIWEFRRRQEVGRSDLAADVAVMAAARGFIGAGQPAGSFLEGGV